MDIAHTRKADLAVAYDMLEAKHEALLAKVASLENGLRAMSNELEASRFECRNLQSMVTAYRNGEIRRDTLTIRAGASAIKVARGLAAAGVPCFARGERVYHSITKAIIAEPSHGSAS